MKLLWDAIGTEFGGRHELYERNYAGNHELIRMSALFAANNSGDMGKMEAFAQACMDEYDESVGKIQDILTGMTSLLLRMITNGNNLKNFK